MSKRIKWLSLLLAVGMIASLAACGGDSAGGSSTPPASTAPSESEAPPAETESAPEEEMSSLDILLSMEDQLPLGGLQPAYLESREDINKALPMTKTNDDDITIGWLGQRFSRLHLLHRAL